MSKRLLTDWLDSYVEYTKNSEPPTLYHMWTGISVIAACLRRKCLLNWGTITFYPNMYIVLVGPSGRCRKGTAMSIGFKFLKQMGLSVAAESITREALIRELRESNDTQVDAATGAMHTHASLTIYSQELTVFLGYNNQQLMADLADWYDCRDQWTYRTKNMGTDDIQGVWVNLFGATTPELLQTTLPRDAIGGGLTSRMLFVYEQNKKHTVVCPMLTEAEERLGKDLEQDLARIAGMMGEFSVTEDFLIKWAEWYTATDKADPIFDDYRFSGYVERRPTHLLKMCIILSASRSDERVITGSDFDRALAIMKRTEVKMPFTFSGMGKFKDSEVMQRVMSVVAHNREITLSDLQRRFYQDVDKSALERIVETMQIMRFIKIGYTETGETTLYYTNEKNIKVG